MTAAVPRVAHTPEPWHLSGDALTVYSLHGHPLRNRFSASLQAGRADDAPLAEMVANARLMRAAPKLLAALQALTFERCNRDTPAYRAALAAIAEAYCGVVAAPSAPAVPQPLTEARIHELWSEVAAEVSHMEMQHHYRFASWLKVAVRLTERAHGIGTAPTTNGTAPQGEQS